MGRLPSVLRADEALIEYLVTPQRTLAFVATSQGVGAVSLPLGAEDLHARIRTVRALIGRAADSERAVPALAELHRRLVAPLEQAGLLDSVRHLIVVPHGPLAQLPFAALLDTGRGRYLIEDRVVRYAPSAAGLVALEERARRIQAPDRVAVFAPFPERLPGTVAEAEAARGSRRVERVMGRRATEQRVRVALGRSQIVHLATHGVLEPTEPLRSRLELAPGGRGGGDGRLEVAEVLAMRVRAPWVVLSGCESAVAGTWQTAFGRGDDLSTLAAAFAYAGALGVVATLWRVPDRGSAVLAAAFYANLRQGGPAEALARAQRSLLSSPEFGAPYHWAGHTALGARGNAQSRPALSVGLRYQDGHQPARAEP
jgi:CHAT domain-containing protein